MERKWNCVSCGWTTTDNTIQSCPDCTDSLLLIPLVLDNALFLAVDEVVTYYYKLDNILNSKEDAVELFDQLNNEKVATIRDWDDFKRFFGNYFYSRYCFI